MGILELVVVMVTIAGLFVWNRAEGRADSRKTDQENKELRRELIDVMRSIEKEIKDFHGRLCAIEERNRKP